MNTSIKMNKIGKITAVLSMLVIGMFVAQSCVQDDEYATPPIVCPEEIPSTVTLSELVNLVKNKKLNLTNEGTIADEMIVNGYVITSDLSGNIYKTMSLQDSDTNPTAGVQIELDEGKMYAEYPLGAKVQLRLKGLVAALDGELIKIGTKDPDYAVGRMPKEVRERAFVKLCHPLSEIKPVVYKTLKEALTVENINTLVTIEGLQFLQPEIDLTYSELNKTLNRVLVDKDNNQVFLRNSGRSNFYGEKLPTTSGKITVLVSKFGKDFQLFIRDVRDVNFDQPRFEVGGGNTGGGNPEPSASAVNLFAGADFEDWSQFLGALTSHGLKDKYVSQGVGTGYEGTNSLHINGVPTGNDYVFTANAADNIPQNPTAITFRMKGKTTVRGLSFNVNATSNVTTGAAPQKYYVFNLPSVTSESVVLDYVQGNDYRGTIDTNGQWITIKLNIKDLKDLNLKNQENGFFSVKAGSTGQYDIHIDNIRIE